VGLQQLGLRRFGNDCGEGCRETVRRFLARESFCAAEDGGHDRLPKRKESVPNRAYGHTKDANGFKETDQSSTSATLGDGGIYSSVDDLSKWDDALRNHTLLSEEEMRPALVPAKFGGNGNTGLPDDAPTGLRGAPVEYGFGWFLDPYKGHKRMWHYGDTDGIQDRDSTLHKRRLDRNCAVQPNGLGSRRARDVRRRPVSGGAIN